MLKEMDAYVIRTKRENPSKIKKKERTKSMKQVKIEALPVSMTMLCFCYGILVHLAN